MTDPTPDQIDRVRKLLAKAEAAGTTPEESAALNDKAAELMAKYVVDQAMLTATTRLNQERIIQKWITPLGGSTYSHEYVSLGIYIAEALGCKGIIGAATRSRKVLIVVGFESDIAQVEMLYASIALQCSLRVGPFVRRETKPWHSGSDKYNMRRAFIHGFGTGVAERLKRTITEAADADSSTALVLVDRNAKLNQWLEDNMRLRTSRRNYDIGAHGAGYTAGRLSDVGTPKLDTARKEIGR